MTDTKQTTPATAGLLDVLAAIVGADHVFSGEAISDDYTHDESLTVTAVVPLAVVRPADTAQVSAIAAACNERGIPVTGRGSGTGLSGAAVPLADGVLISFERFDQILELDTENHVAVVQAGVTLEQLDAATAALGLVYPVFPGENSASLGGNVNTNAGGMRAVKYGVTRNQVLGLEVVLATGEVMRTGGKYVKATTGYDLTQLIVGSEGTLALVTEVTIKLYPRPPYAATVLAPFKTLAEVSASVPRLVDSGVGPLIVEYIDLLTMSVIVSSTSVELGIPADVKEQALAYLVVVVEQRTEDRLDEDVQAVAELLDEQGAMDVYILPSGAGQALIEAREKSFWMAKSAGANDIVDIVVPRAAIPDYMERVSALATASGSWIAGCGHAGDGNVHLGVFQGDPAVRHQLMHDLFAAGMDVGGAISGEHGLGTEKKSYYLELEDPVKVDLMRRVKAAFDPNGILNPGTIFD